MPGSKPGRSIANPRHVAALDEFLSERAGEVLRGALAHLSKFRPDRLTAEETRRTAELMHRAGAAALTLLGPETQDAGMSLSDIGQVVDATLERRSGKTSGEIAQIVRDELGRLIVPTIGQIEDLFFEWSERVEGPSPVSPEKPDTVIGKNLSEQDEVNARNPQDSRRGLSDKELYILDGLRERVMGMGVRGISSQEILAITADLRSEVGLSSGPENGLSMRYKIISRLVEEGVLITGNRKGEYQCVPCGERGAAIEQSMERESDTDSVGLEHAADNDEQSVDNGDDTLDDPHIDDGTNQDLTGEPVGEEKLFTKDDAVRDLIEIVLGRRELGTKRSQLISVVHGFMEANGRVLNKSNVGNVCSDLFGRMLSSGEVVVVGERSMATYYPVDTLEEHRVPYLSAELADSANQMTFDGMADGVEKMLGNSDGHTDEESCDMQQNVPDANVEGDESAEETEQTTALSITDEGARERALSLTVASPRAEATRRKPKQHKYLDCMLQNGNVVQLVRGDVVMELDADTGYIMQRLMEAGGATKGLKFVDLLRGCQAMFTTAYSGTDLFNVLLRMDGLLAQFELMIEREGRSDVVLHLRRSLAEAPNSSGDRAVARDAKRKPVTDIHSANRLLIGYLAGKDDYPVAADELLEKYDETNAIELAELIRTSKGFRPNDPIFRSQISVIADTMELNAARNAFKRAVFA